MFRYAINLVIFALLFLTACERPYTTDLPENPTPAILPTDVFPRPQPTGIITFPPTDLPGADNSTPPPSPNSEVTAVMPDLTSEPASTSIPPVIEPVFKPEYVVQGGSPVLSPDVFSAQRGCNWSGVAGQVFSRDETPALGLVVEVEGALNGQPIFGMSITGSAPQYGAGGFEISLNEQPIFSEGSLQLTLFDMAGNPLSEAILFDTSADCNQNLVILNFRAADFYSQFIYLPLVNDN